MARSVSNWGRWGPDDQLGTLNYITPEAVTRAAQSIRLGQTISLSIPFDSYGPQGGSGFRRNPIHLMTLDGGDHDLSDRLAGWGGATEAGLAYTARGPMHFNDDYIIMPLQAATQLDALSHVYYEGQLYNGYPSDTVTSLGATRDSIDRVAAAGKVIGRGVLLDVARHKGVDHLPARTVVTPEDLDATADDAGVDVFSGDIVLVRTGWWQRFLQTRNGDEWALESPGLGWRCAQWLSDRSVAAVACDNIAVEVTTPEWEGVILPLHMLVLRDMGMMLGEMWDLEVLAAECAKDRRYDFFLSATPLLISGAVGSPINPVAIR
jgi:kynurenine formamidase